MATYFRSEILIEDTERQVKKAYHRCPTGNLHIIGKLIVKHFAKRKLDKYGVQVGPWEKVPLPATCDWCGGDLDWGPIKEDGWLSDT